MLDIYAVVVQMVIVRTAQTM